MTLRPVLLSGYAAKSCARATHNRYDPTVPEQPSETPPELQRLFDHGNDHEAAVFDAWLAAGTDVADLRSLDDDKDTHIASTVEAMDSTRRVILGGRLPDDILGGRTGKPDVLLLDLVHGGYHPADVKAHKVIDSKTSGGVATDLTRPSLSEAVEGEAGLRYDQRDLLQLAHYWRMLEACGHQACRPFGAIIGTDPADHPQLAWYDLTEPLFTTFSRTRGKATRSSLERYDHEHDFRVRVARTAQQRTGAASDPLPLVEPIGQDECATCAWAPVCIDILPTDDLSRELQGTLTVREYLALRAAGVATVDELVDADLEELLGSEYADETSHVHGRARRLRKAHTHAQLAQAGAVLRVIPGAVFDVRRGEVEIDLDMECDREGRVYLWGALVTTRGASAYKAFTDVHATADGTEHELALKCFDWLAETYPEAVVFHYSSVEKTKAQRILGDHLDTYGGTSADPTTWVDLLPAVQSCLESRQGLGLKVVATVGADFHWRDEDPGGLQSRDWLDQARAGDAAAEQRILTYNEDDVRATLAVREWLSDLSATGGSLG